MAMKSSTTNWK